MKTMTALEKEIVDEVFDGKEPDNFAVIVTKETDNLDVLFIIHIRFDDKLLKRLCRYETTSKNPPEFYIRESFPAFKRDVEELKERYEE